jgi:TonB family protein
MKPLVTDPVVTADARGALARRVELLVVSPEDEFLIELGPVIGERYRTHPVDTPGAIATVGSEHAPRIILLDGNALEDARGAVALIEQAHPRLPIIVIAAARDDDYWRAAVARGAIIDVITRAELSGDRIKAALARAEARARSAVQSPVAAAPGSNNRMPLLIGAIAASFALAVIGWFALRHTTARQDSESRSAVQITPTSATTDTAAKTQSVLELLSAARVAFRDQKLLLPRSDGEPRGDSALELYAQVLALEPGNEEALDGLQRLYSVARARIQADLAANKLDEAVRLLAAFKSANVDPAGVHDMDATIAAARPKWLAARAQESLTSDDLATAEQMIAQLAPLDRAAAMQLQHTLALRKTDQQTLTQLTALSAQVKTAIDAGDLIETGNDSARTRVQAMRQINRTHPLTLAAQRDLQSALLAQAQDLSHKEQFDPAQRLINAASEFGATAEVAAAKRQLQSDMDASAAAAAAAQVAAKKTTVSTNPGISTPSPSLADATPYIAARPAQPLKAKYPTAAAEANLKGYVIVEFMLQPDGSAAAASVVESTPAQVFDKAALDAVAGGHFDTSALSGQTPRRARLRLTFKPS